VLGVCRLPLFVCSSAVLQATAPILCAVQSQWAASVTGKHE